MGHQSQRIFLVSGIASLVTKVLLLAVAVTFSDTGLQTQVYERPFLLFCFDKNSTYLNENLNETDVLKCTMTTVDSHLNETATDPEKQLNKTLAQLEEDWLAKYDLNITIIEDDLKTERPGRSELFRTKLNGTSTLSAVIRLIKEEVEENLQSVDSKAGNTPDIVPCIQSSGSERVQQKIRICEDAETEFQFRLGLLSGLLVIVTLAAFSTYKLHKIADYQVYNLK